MEKDIRWIQRFDNYKKGLLQLKNAVKLSKTRKLSCLEEQGLIQAFEYTHELSWKTLKDYFYEKGNNNVFGSKDATRLAFNYGIIINGEIWMDMIKSRNQTSHTYNEEVAEQIANSIINDYFDEFINLEKKLKELIDNV